MVLTQAEKFESEVGAKYWISPTGLHPNRVSFIKRRRKEEGIKTSLTNLSRAVNLTCIKNSKNGVDDKKFENFVEDQINEIKVNEKKYGDKLELTTNMNGDFERLPFLFFIPKYPTGATLKLTGIDDKENEVPVTPFAYVEEIKNGQHITRLLENGET